MKKYLILGNLLIIAVLSTSATLKPNSLYINISKNIDTIGESLVVIKPKIELLEKENKEEIIELKNAHVSYYGGKFHGRKTASGQIYDKNKLTAAHKTLPFGTKVEFTNEKTNESIIVTINDRGPFVKGRMFDLSEKAFSKIMNGTSAGIAKLKYKIIVPESKTDEKINNEIDSLLIVKK